MIPLTSLRVWRRERLSSLIAWPGAECCWLLAAALLRTATLLACDRRLESFKSVSQTVRVRGGAWRRGAFAPATGAQIRGEGLGCAVRLWSAPVAREPLRPDASLPNAGSFAGHRERVRRCWKTGLSILAWLVASPVSRGSVGSSQKFVLPTPLCPFVRSPTCSAQ